jgi:oxygen-independent coproporphyrinogen-3 oxidase
LRELGFNRVSFGVQDFDPAVQAAINRVQSAEDTLALIEASRRAGYRSVSVDLIYGLPKQAPLAFARTLARVEKASPDRVALYNYAHLPALFKSQRQMRDEDLPTAAARLELFELAHRRFQAAGYLHIGMDHFARPDDQLAVAQRQGLLHRDFQGYSAGPEADLVGLGVSAIGAIGATYSQNHRVLSSYRQCLERGELPIMRGIALDADDLTRRAVIQALICHFAVCKGAIGMAHLIDFDRYFDAERESLREFEELGLIEQDADWLTITAKGRMLVRQICMAFDRHLGGSPAPGYYSRVA